MRSTEFLYRPQHKDRNELINDFVIRNSIYDRILHGIATQKISDPAQHVLIEGKRGMGKTTLMLRLSYEIQNDKKLSKRFVPCKFNEEEYGIANLATMWERVAEHLEDDKRFEGILDLFDEIEGSNDEEKFISEITKWLEEKKVIAVVFIDNFFQIIEKFNDREQQRLREVLIKTPNLKIIAGSARFLEKNAGDYSSPFFEFFKREKLNKLNKKETKQLLVHLAKKHKADNVIDTIKNEPQRIDNIRILCGGVPRTLITFFEVLMDDANGSSMDDLKLVMDRTNELYLQRMNSLSKKEQPIINAMALHWEAITTGELAEKIGEKSGTLSAILNKLTKQQIIEKVKTDTKNHLWRIEERFFNIWYLLTQAPRRYQRKVKWLTAFIEVLYCEKDFKKRLAIHFDKLEDGKLNLEYASTMTNALSQSKLISMEAREYLIERTKEFFSGLSVTNEVGFPKTEIEIQDSVVSNVVLGKVKIAESKIEELPEGEVKSSYLALIRSYKSFPYQKSVDIDGLNEFVRRHKDANLVISQLRELTENNIESSRSELQKLGEYRLSSAASVVSHIVDDPVLIEPLASLLSDINFYDGLLVILLRLEKLGDKRVLGLIGALHLFKKDSLNAIKYFERVLKTNHLPDRKLAFDTLMNIYFSQEYFMEMKKLVKNERRLFLKKAVSNKNEASRLAQVVGALLINDLDYALKISKEIIERHISSSSELVHISFNIILAVGQYNFLLQFFKKNNELKNEFLAYYFLTTKLYNQQNEFKKAPPELLEPIEKLEETVKGWSSIFEEFRD